MSRHVRWSAGAAVELSPEQKVAAAWIKERAALQAEVGALREALREAHARCEAALLKAARASAARGILRASKEGELSRLSADVERLRAALEGENASLRAGAAAANRAMAELRSERAALEAELGALRGDTEARAMQAEAEVRALRLVVGELQQKRREDAAELRVLRAVQESVKKGVSLLQQRSAQLGGAPEGLVPSPIVARAPSPHRKPLFGGIR